MKQTRRTTQVGDVIRAELSLILQREMNDPDFGFLTVTDVELSSDLRHARVFVSSLKKGGDAQKTLTALQKAAGHLRHLLAQRANLRYTPELNFKLDSTAERAESINRILQKVKPTDDSNS